jgi:ferredoxin/flavodoxin---NADP+ reductase
MCELGTESRPLRVAIIGSGPSGFYAAEALLKSEVFTTVDMFERLISPYGLVRSGVAPDHQKIKNVIKVYERIAAKEGFTYFGNVEFGKDLLLEDVKNHYDAIIFANGAQSDRNLNIPGEDLPGSHPATDFVDWYNGHPDFRDHEFDLSHDTAVVIGQGNVAIDVCRILCKTVDELKSTDIAKHALDQLAASNIRNVHMIGRRGPVQAKFTQVEIKELGHLSDCNAHIDPAAFNFDPASQQELDDPANKLAPKIIPIMQNIANSEPDPSKSRTLYIDFCRSPKEITGNGRVESIIFERNELIGEPFHIKAHGTGETESMDCGFILRSVGYRGAPLPGIPFDDNRGIFPNDNGRIITDHGEIGLYAVGWIKRGPSGVIGTNKPDSQETVKQLLADLQQLTPCPKPETKSLQNELKGRGIRLVSYEEWKKIDFVEIAEGEKVGKPREKCTRTAEMLDIIENSGKHDNKA